MDERSHDHHVEERQVEQMPETEHPFVGIQLGDLAHAAQVLEREMRNAGPQPLVLLRDDRRLASQLAKSPPDHAPETDALPARRESELRWQQQRGCDAVRRLEHRFVEHGDSLEQLRHEHGNVLALLGRHSGFGGELAQRHPCAVEIRVDLCVNVAADEAAAGHEEHADQRDVAVQRAEGEVRVKKDQHGPEHAEHHVHAEPMPGRAEVAHEPQLLAQRVEQQHGHQARADDAEPIADALERIDEMRLAID